jgi:tetratricopeptide (TPR) repeat protein
VLSGYRLIRELGRGGMSVVWLAERADGVLKRQVALKMPMFMLQGAADQERFSRERDALASLSHRNVAQLFDAGVLASGQPFIVLEYVDGQSLTAYCDERRLDLEARVRLFLQVLAAVEHAHKHLIVHRDLKPSNILVDREGQVKLLDFGIAKLLGDPEGANALTQRDGGALTPLYAGPEQIRGGAISTLTDVFSLGVVLCELLSGSLPYRGAKGRATLVEIVEAISRGDLPRTSQVAADEASANARGFGTVGKLRDALGGDLDTIVGKALRVSPEDRYASAAHLADDLRRWLDHQPIAARAPSFWYSSKLALRRHRLAASVAGVGFVLVMGASVVAWAQFLQSRANAQRTAAVRDFMFELVNDAEATEGQQGEITGRQMLDGAVKRARRDFGSQPQLQGELLSELGRMYTRLSASDSAVPVLEESLRILEPRVAADDAALNRTRAILAGALLDTTDDMPRIARLANAAREGCANDSVDCAKVVTYASNVLGQVAAHEGDEAAAMAEMQRSAESAERAFGIPHDDTALAYLNLSVIARNMGKLQQADDAVQRAVVAAQGVKMRAGDRAIMDRTLAVVAYDQGRFAEARDRLLALNESTTDWSRRAVQLRILANVEVELGAAPAALARADEALALHAANGAGSDLPFARQARARALAMLQRPDDALAEMDAAIDGMLAAGRGENSYEILRAHRYRAEYLMLAGRTAEALPTLRDLKARHERAPTSAVERGLMLDLLGEAERRAGRAGEAQSAHAAARAALAEQLDEQHPFMVRNAALRGSASQ